MTNYLKTSDDEYGYVSTLVRQMNSDGEIAIREEGFIRAKSMAYGISTEDFNKMFEKAKSTEWTAPNFSSKAVAVQTVMDAIDLSAIDLDFAKSETASMFDIGADLDVSSDEETRKALAEYMSTWLENSKKFEGLLATIFGKVVPLDKILPEDQDKKSFLIAMMRVVYADKKKEDVEVAFIRNMSRVYAISEAVINEAISDFKLENESLSFSNDGSACFTLREATRIASTDFEVNESEKAELDKIAKEIGADLDASLFDEIKEAVAGRHKAAELREKAFRIYYKKIVGEEP